MTSCGVGRMERSVSSQVIPPTSQPPLGLTRYVWVDLRLTQATGQRPLILLRFGLVQCVASPGGISDEWDVDLHGILRDSTVAVGERS